MWTSASCFPRIRRRCYSFLTVKINGRIIRPRPHGYVFIWKHKHFVAFSCPVHTKTMKTMYRFQWKRKLLKTLTVSASCGRVNSLKTQLKNDWSCDLSRSHIHLKNPRWRISTESVLLLFYWYLAPIKLDCELAVECLCSWNAFYTYAVQGWVGGWGGVGGGW